MSEMYSLNPFSFISETASAIIINTTPHVQVSFSKANREIVDLLMGDRALSSTELLRHLAPSRIRELVAKRVLLTGGVPPLDGRYSRQLGYFSLTTANFEDTQERLGSAHVLILGAGALGTHVAWNLAAIGVGKITIVDFDRIEATNLNRQLMYTPEDVGQLKVDVLGKRIRQFNPTIDVIPVNKRITSPDDIASMLGGTSLVIKAIDTPEESTAWLNEACVAAQIPYVNGGFLDFTGVVGPVYIPGHSLCLACFSPPGQVKRLGGTGATFAPLTTIVTSHLSMIAYKILVGDVRPLVDKLHSFDTARMSWRADTLTALHDCPVCTRPAKAPAVQKEPGRALWGYRATVALLMATAVILRVAFDQSKIGAFTLLAMLVSVPVVRLLQGGDASRTRRELFIGSVIYIGLSGLGLIAQRLSEGGFSLPHSAAAALDLARQASIGVLELSIGITVLFFMLCIALEAFNRTVYTSQQVKERS